MRIYIGLVLSECVCTMAGFGAYPSASEPKPGNGPTQFYEKSPEDAAGDSYSFETVRNVSPYGADFCTTFREGMKHWNITVQYWLAVNVYKRFPNKQFRTGVTMLVSAAWHGVYTGYYACIGGAPFYLLVEDVYVKLFIKNNTGMVRL